MNPIELTELGPGLELPLMPEQGRALARSDVVTAAPSPYSSGLWEVGPARKVGAARVGDIEIHIRPKVGIARLLFLAGFSEHGSAWRPEAVPIAEAAGLVPAFAQALWRQTERAIHQGLLPGYVVVEESLRCPELSGQGSIRIFPGKEHDSIARETYEIFSGVQGGSRQDGGGLIPADRCRCPRDRG